MGYLNYLKFKQIQISRYKTGETFPNRCEEHKKSYNFQTDYCLNNGFFIHYALENYTGIIYFPVMSAKIFISYGERDYETAGKLYDDLKAAGFSPWMNKKNILPGQDWKLETRQAILESSYFLVLLSEISLSAKGYFWKELKTAMKTLDEMPPSEIFILPVRLDACKSAYESLRDIQHTDLFPSYDEGLRQIVYALESPGDEKESRRFVDKKILKKERKSLFEPGFVLLTLFCFVVIAAMVTTILFVFFPIETKGKASWEQAIPAVLGASVFCSVLLTLAKVYRHIALKTIIILLVPLCMGFSVVTSAFILKKSPFKIIRVIMTSIEKDNHSISEKQDKVMSDTTEKTDKGANEILNKADENDISENKNNSDSESVLSETVSTEEKQRHTSIMFNTKPKAAFSTSSKVNDRQLTVFFEDKSLSHDGIVSWNWDFGDGGSSYQQNPTRSYFRKGNYNVILTVIDKDGDADSYAAAITVNGIGPKAIFSTSSKSGEPLTIFFKDKSLLYGGIISWNWDFGDGENSYQRNPIHIYTQKGSYNVVLTITGPDGTTYSYAKFIMVPQIPIY